MNRAVIAAALTLFLTHHALAQLAASAEFLPDFRASVRFHYRERIPDAAPGEKNVSAPADEEEKLPPARLLPEKGRRVIQGKVADLPFVFYLRLTHPDRQASPVIEANVVDPRTNRAIEGFPAKQSLTDVVGFEIPLTKEQARLAQRALGDNPLVFLTYVDLEVRLEASE